MLTIVSTALGSHTNTTFRDISEAFPGGEFANLFRADLFYRLNVIPLELPPLRSRPDDIPLLATHLLEKHVAVMGRPRPHMSPAVVDALARHAWPGNVRELENVILRALALSRGDAIELDALPSSVLPKGAAPRPAESRGSTNSR